MNSKIVRVELGCGKTKSPGFIGIDRFPLEEVDIVADLNKGIPLEDNSVDIILASHSLEHLDNLVSIMKEIYRVCKHKAIVCIIAPYYHTYLNISNPYHKQVFNEHTLRFFTNQEIIYGNQEDYDFPNSPYWGLGSSDNSELSINLRCVNMEFFYLPKYELLSEAEQRTLRQSQNNVCDQIMYHLMVIKEPITDQEIKETVKCIGLFEPQYIFTRKVGIEIKKLNKEKEALHESLIQKEKECQVLKEEAERLKTHLDSAVLETDNLRQEREALVTDFKEVDSEKQKLEKQINIFESHIRSISQENQALEQTLIQERSQNKLLLEKANLIGAEEARKVQNIINSAKVWALEWRRITNSRGFKLIKRLRALIKPDNILADIADRDFMAHAIVASKENLNQHKMRFSEFVPSEAYCEYKINIPTGSTSLLIYVINYIHCDLFVEFVQDNAIVSNKIVKVNRDGVLDIPVSRLSGEVFVRFKTLNSHDLISVLEWYKIKMFVRESVQLVYCCR